MSMYEPITENSITYAHTVITDAAASATELTKLSDTLIRVRVLCNAALSYFIKKRRKKLKISAEIICAARSMYPALREPKVELPTARITNAGPALTEQQRSTPAFSGDIFFSLTDSFSILAPVG